MRPLTPMRMCHPPSAGVDRRHRDRAIGIAFIGLLVSFRPALVGVQGPDARAAASVGPDYTVQIQSAPAARRVQVLQTYEGLKAEGHLVYCCDAYVHERAYVRLRAGFFKDRDKARAYAEALRENEGFAGFVAQANLAIASFGEAFDIITTPNDIWFQSQTSLRPLYHFDTAEATATCSAVTICPAGRYIAFSCDNRMIKIDLHDDSMTVLRRGERDEALFNSTLAWSPDGQRIAYLDTVGWELPTKLWIMRSDGSDNRCLAGDDTGWARVKSLQWHPCNDTVFYVSGPAHGTVSVGGSLCQTDLYGNHEVMVPACAAERVEVCSEFCVTGNEIHYQLAHFDADCRVQRHTTHRIPMVR